MSEEKSRRQIYKTESQNQKGHASGLLENRSAFLLPDQPRSTGTTRSARSESDRGRGSCANDAWRGKRRSDPRAMRPESFVQWLCTQRKNKISAQRPDLQRFLSVLTCSCTLFTDIRQRRMVVGDSACSDASLLLAAGEVGTKTASEFTTLSRVVVRLDLDR